LSPGLHLYFQKGVPAADCDLAAPARGKVSFTVQAANFCTNKANLKCNLLSSVTKVAANPAYKSGWLGMTRARALLMQFFFSLSFSRFLFNAPISF
jgi:hypothetical protein